MERYEKLTEALSDEELMELTGGFVSAAKSMMPLVFVCYGVIATIPLSSIIGKISKG